MLKTDGQNNVTQILIILLKYCTGLNNSFKFLSDIIVANGNNITKKTFHT